MRLLTIEEHNDRIVNSQPDQTFVACPNCSTELKQKNPGMVLLTSPPQIKVQCFECGWEGSIYARTLNVQMPIKEI